jgi:hypothetical protein
MGGSRASVSINRRSRYLATFATRGRQPALTLGHYWVNSLKRSTYQALLYFCPTNTTKVLLYNLL